MDENLLLTDDKVNKYFATINPIAAKIQNDIDIIKSKYSKNWNNLNLNDQVNIINGAILSSKISLKYFVNTPIIGSKLQHGQNVQIGSSDGDAANNQVSSTKSTYNNYDKELSMYCKIKTGRKFLHDDTFGGFRDEHSAPFSFKSKSQVNLNIFPVVSEACNSNVTNSCDNSFTNNDSVDDNYNPVLTSDQNEETKIDLNRINLETNFLNYNNVTNSAGITNIISRRAGGDRGHSQMFSNFLLKGKKFDGSADGTNDDEEALVNFERISSKSSMPSEEEIDERNIEIKSLLRNNEIRKDYDFLANW